MAYIILVFYIHIARAVFDKEIHEKWPGQTAKHVWIEGRPPSPHPPPPRIQYHHHILRSVCITDGNGESKSDRVKYSITPIEENI